MVRCTIFYKHEMPELATKLDFFGSFGRYAADGTLGG